MQESCIYKEASIKLALLVAAAAAAPFIAHRGQWTESPVRWDPRIELVSIVFHLAGAPGYVDGRVPGYAEAVKAHFAPWRDHAAIQATRELGAKHRLGFFHPMNFAVHLTRPPGLAERIPLDQPGLALGARWQSAPFRPYLEQLRAFYRDARVDEFFAAQAPLYELSAERLRAAVTQEIDQAWFHQYVGSGAETAFMVTPSLLNGGAQYAATYRAPGVEEAYAIIGIFKVDPEGLPRFDRSDADNVAHEFAHTLTNRHVDAIIGQLDTAGPALFESVRDLMRRQSYGTWQTMVYEQVVRAVVVRYIAFRRGEAAALAEIEAQEALGFKATRAIAAVLIDYEANRSRGDGLASVMPRIVSAFGATKQD